MESGITHSEARNSVTRLRTSESLFDVSSNPGVSTRTTSFPSSWNGFDNSIFSVHDIRLSLVLRLDPLARFMN